MGVSDRVRVRVTVRVTVTVTVTVTVVVAVVVTVTVMVTVTFVPRSFKSISPNSFDAFPRSPCKASNLGQCQALGHPGRPQSVGRIRIRSHISVQDRLRGPRSRSGHMPPGSP